MDIILGCCLIVYLIVILLSGYMFFRNEQTYNYRRNIANRVHKRILKDIHMGIKSKFDYDDIPSHDYIFYSTKKICDKNFISKEMIKWLNKK